MQNQSTKSRRTRTHRGKTVVAREAGFSIREKGNGFIVQIRRKGIRETKTFSTLDAAKLYCHQVDTKRTNEGLSAFTLSPVQRDDATRALAMLENRASLVAAAKAWLRLNPANGGTTFSNLAEMLEAHMEAKGLRERSISDVHNRCNKFAADFGSRIVGTITREEIEQWLSTRYAGNGFNNARLVLSAAFAFAVKKGYIETNPIAAIAAKKIDRGEPEFWPVATVASMMKVAAAYDAEKSTVQAQFAAQRLAKGKEAREPAAPILPALALSAFAGMRPDEAAKLDWACVNFDESLIRIPANVSKVRRARIVPMTENLVRWLMPYRKPSGRIAPSAVTIKRARKTLLEKAELPAEWPQDVLRHSFATYWMAAHAHEGKLAEMMGNSPAVIQRHYKGLATAKEGVKYFAIMPPSANTVIQLNNFAAA